jgi:polyhydroxybutyrate depolymerase
MLLVLGANARQAQALDQRHLQVNGVDRTYLIHLPPAAVSPAPLLLVLHGGGSTAQATERNAGFDGVADANGFIAVYPSGIDLGWADGRGMDPPDQAGVDDVAFIGSVLDDVSSQYAVDPERVYVTGISNGAFMAQRLACDLSDRIVAIAPVAGTLSTGVSCQPDRPVSVLEMHGTADPLVPYLGGTMTGRGGQSTIVSVADEVSAWAGRDGCPEPPQTSSPPPLVNDGTRLETTTYDGCQDGTAVWLYTLVGGGHTWPNGAQYLPVRLIGPVSHQVDAPTAIWSFFASHPRS